MVEADIASRPNLVAVHRATLFILAADTPIVPVEIGTGQRLALTPHSIFSLQVASSATDLEDACGAGP